MAVKAVLSSALLAAVLAAPRPDGVPVYGPPAPVAYPDEAPVYKYTYAVKDDYSFSNFNAHEERDGYNTAGGYQVALPDGRTQIVTYTATPEGYIADVRYEGEAKYPEYKPTYPAAPAPAPAYKPAPAPAYKPAPVYAPKAPVYHAAPVYAPATPVVYTSKIVHAEAEEKAAPVVEEEEFIAAEVAEDAPAEAEAGTEAPAY